MGFCALCTACFTSFKQPCRNVRVLGINTDRKLTDCKEQRDKTD